MTNNVIYIIFTLIAGWCLHIIYEDIVNIYYREQTTQQIKLTEEDKTRLIDKLADSELVASIAVLLAALEYTGDWLEELQAHEPLPKDNQLSKEEWLDQAIYYASMESSKNNNTDHT